MFHTLWTSGSLSAKIHQQKIRWASRLVYVSTARNELLLQHIVLNLHAYPFWVASGYVLLEPYRQEIITQFIGQEIFQHNIILFVIDVFSSSLET